MKRLTLLATLLAATGAALAQSAAPQPPVAQGPQGGPPPHMAQRQGNPEMFQQRKQMMIQLQQQRAKLASDAVACMQAAANPEALRACHEKEQQGMRAVMQEARTDRQELRQERAEMRQHGSQHAPGMPPQGQGPQGGPGMQQPPMAR